MVLGTAVGAGAVLWAVRQSPVLATWRAYARAAYALAMRLGLLSKAKLLLGYFQVCGSHTAKANWQG